MKTPPLPQINNLFKEYLEATGLDIAKLSHADLGERRRAFYAGSGAMLTVLVEYVQKQPDEAAAVAVVENLIKQVQIFFMAEIAMAKPEPASKVILPSHMKIVK